MKLPRRKFLHWAAGAAVLPVVSRFAWGQTYPSRPVRIVVGFPAGTGADIGARLIGQELSERLGQPFLTENRPGAAGNIATEAVVKAASDGHTLLWALSANAISATFFPNLSFDFVRDIAPVASVLNVPMVMVVNPSFPALTVPEFIAYAKANPGKINMASGGNGGTLHLTGELFKMMAGINMTHVPYRGDAPALTDLLGGQVQVLFASMPASIEYIRTGKLRALAITTVTRSEGLPNVPAVGEFVQGYEASIWHGIGAPRGTPSGMIDRLNKEMNSVLADPKTQARLADLGGTALPGSPGDFKRLIAEDTEKWGKVIRAANIKVE